MTITPPTIPGLGVFPGHGAPFPSITAFAMIEGEGLIAYVERFKRYVKLELAPYIGESSNTLIAAFVEQVEKVIEDTNTALEDQATAVNEDLAAQSTAITTQVNTALTNLTTFVNDAVSSIINSTIAVSDPVISAIVHDEDTETRKFLDRYSAELDSRSRPTLTAMSGDAATDAAPEILALCNDAVALGIGRVRLVGDFHLKSFWQMPDNITELIIPKGSRLKVDGLDEAIYKRGTITFLQSLADDAVVAEGTRIIPVPDLRPWVGATWVLIATRVPLNGTSGNFPGWIRKVGTLSPTTGTFDPNNPGSSPVPGTVTVDRLMPRGVRFSDTMLGELKGVKIHRLNLTPTLKISGGGIIEGKGKVAPAAGQKSLVNIALVDNPEIMDIEIANHSKTLLSFYACMNGRVDGAYIHDAYDPGDSDGGGYGITFNGPNRQFVVTRATRINDVRHAITTNTGAELSATGLRKTNRPPDSEGNTVPDEISYGANGEPEACWFGPVSARTTSKAMDSHRLGIDNTYDCHVYGGGGGGVQVRSDRTYVTGQVFNAIGPGLGVDGDVTIPPRVRNFTVSVIRETSGSGRGILAFSPIIADSITISGIVSSSAVRLESDGSFITNLFVDNTPIGVSITAGHKNNYVEGYFSDSVQTWVDENATGTTGNTVINRRIPASMQRQWPNTHGGLRYFGARAEAFGTLVLADGTAAGHLIALPDGELWTASCSVSTADAAASLVLMIYSTTANGELGNLVAQSVETLSAATTGTKAFTFTLGTMIRAGDYVAVVQVNGGSPTLVSQTVAPVRDWYTAAPGPTFFSANGLAGGFTKTGQTIPVAPTLTGTSQASIVPRIGVGVKI